SLSEAPEAAGLPDFAAWDQYDTIHRRNASIVYIRLERELLYKSSGARASTTRSERMPDRLNGLLALALTLLLGGASTWSRAAEGGLPAPAAHTDSSGEWEQLRGKLFGTRPIDTSRSRVQLIVP